MDLAGLIISLVAATLTLISVMFAWRAAVAAREAVGEARQARLEEAERDRVAKLERVADCLERVRSITVDHWQKTGSLAGALELERRIAAVESLHVAIAASGMVLEQCLEVVNNPTGPEIQKAVDEVRDEILERS